MKTNFTSILSSAFSTKINANPGAASNRNKMGRNGCNGCDGKSSK